MMVRALSEVGGTPRLALVCQLVIAWQALEGDDIEAADAAAQAALSLPVARDLRPAAMALAARVQLARGHAGAALRIARDAASLELACTDLELTYGIASVTLAESLDASGDRLGARAVLQRVVDGLDAIAGTVMAIGRPRFWSRRMPNDRVGRLASEWGLSTTWGGWK
jgi:hypothetical protein